MKKITYSFLILVACCNAAFTPIASGKTISPSAAQTVAINFFKQNADIQVSSASLIYTATSSSGDAVYFVFNMNENKGFVIITADDAMYPVIGYSTQGSYVVSDPSSNVGFWMEQRKNEIIANRIQNVQATAEVSSQWTAYLNNQAIAPRIASTVSPMLQTLWNQTTPYDALCPGGTPTGCVATAMAQIMRYWKYPARGTGSSSYNCPNYGALSANYGNTTYNWNNMPTGNITVANNDVATLMYQCGVSVDMLYNPSSSGACSTKYDNDTVCAQISYAKYFGYNKFSIAGLQKSSMPDASWLIYIETDLDAGHPIEYGGYGNANSGHDWVCDGYDANNNFHMNWGWGGLDDGYYTVTSLNPGTDDFSLNQEAIIGIKPTSVTGIPSITDDELFNIYPNPATNQLTLNITSASTGSATVSIMNVLGETVLSYSPLLGRSLSLSKGEALDISKLPAGIYFLEMKTENAIDTKRFIKE